MILESLNINVLFIGYLFVSLTCIISSLSLVFYCLKNNHSDGAFFCGVLLVGCILGFGAGLSGFFPK